MKSLHRFFAAVLLLVGCAGAIAGGSDPLFINLTTDDSHRANMAIAFGKAQQERGHPLTIYLNDRAVQLVSTAHGSHFAEQQKALADVAGKGATVIVCPMCMKHYGVGESQLLPIAKVGNPDLTGAALFRDGTQTLSW
jgi:sulfur relay (sulfurtransferase) complex TusBCD TusD component (DsrE family)